MRLRISEIDEIGETGDIGENGESCENGEICLNGEVVEITLNSKIGEIGEISE